MTNRPPKRRNDPDSPSNADDHDETSSHKRSKLEIVPVDSKVVAVHKADERTSGLLSPTMMLSGHDAAIYSFSFDPTGDLIASASFDRTIFLWQVYGECRNYNVLRGHKNAVLDVHWTPDSRYVVSASADKTVGVWDAETGQKLKKFQGHTSIVNSCCPIRRGPTLVVSGSDDGSAKLWDIRVKRCIQSFQGKYQVTSVCFTDDGESIITGGLDGDIKIWELRRKNEVSFKLTGHSDIITGMSLSPNGHHLLSNSMDNTVRKWDVRPFVTGERCQAIFHGVKHNFEKNLIKCGWSPDGNRVTCGSSDRHVYIWDANTTQLLYHLPGHTGTVNQAAFHPKEPIVGSCGNDKTIYLGELVM